jgi:hypothetical protein
MIFLDHANWLASQLTKSIFPQPKRNPNNLAKDELEEYMNYFIERDHKIKK